MLLMSLTDSGQPQRNFGADILVARRHRRHVPVARLAVRLGCIGSPVGVPMPNCRTGSSALAAGEHRGAQARRADADSAPTRRPLALEAGTSRGGERPCPGERRRRGSGVRWTASRRAQGSASTGRPLLGSASMRRCGLRGQADQPPSRRQEREHRLGRLGPRARRRARALRASNAGQDLLRRSLHPVHAACPEMLRRALRDGARRRRDPSGATRRPRWAVPSAWSATSTAPSSSRTPAEDVDVGVPEGM